MTAADRLLPLREVRDALGCSSNSTIDERLVAGLLTPPLVINQRVRVWPASEVSAVVRAVMAGATPDDVRSLVQRLTARRPKLDAVLAEIEGAP